MAKRGWRSANLSPDRRIFFGQGRGGVHSRELASRIAASFGSKGGGSTADLLFPLLFPPTLISVTPNSGLTAGGDSVDLAGMNFQPGATVLFGATSAPVVSVTPTHITVTTPTHVAGPVSVTVTNPDLQSSTLANAFTFFGLIIPDDALTIFHFYVRNGLAKNLFGTLLETAASTGRVGATDVTGIPAHKTAEGAGPNFTAGRFFTLPSGLINFNNDYWITMIIQSGPNASGSGEDQVLAGYSGTTGGGNSTGLNYALNEVGGYITDFEIFSSASAGLANSVIPNPIGHAVITTLSQGQSGNTFFQKRDLTNAISNVAAGVVMTPFTGSPKIGFFTAVSPTGASQQGFRGLLFEMRITRTIPTLAGMNALHTAIFS
jgi:hypothetical protein